MSAEQSKSPREDEWIDMVVPEEVDWRELVREYPLTAMGVVAVAGFLIGRFQGDRVVDLGRAFAVRQVSQTLGQFGLGDADAESE